MEDELFYFATFLRLKFFSNTSFFATEHYFIHVELIHCENLEVAEWYAFGLLKDFEILLTWLLFSVVL